MLDIYLGFAYITTHSCQFLFRLHIEKIYVISYFYIISFNCINYYCDWYLLVKFIINLIVLAFALWPSYYYFMAAHPALTFIFKLLNLFNFAFSYWCLSMD